MRDHPQTDDRLISETRRLGRHRTKKEAVRASLEEYVARRRREEVLRAFGTIDFDSAWNYKAERGRVSE